MYTVTFTRNYINAINFQYPVINTGSTLNEVIDYIALSKPTNSREHHIFDVKSDDCELFTVILSPDYIYIIFTGYGTRVYDYSYAGGAREFIKITAHLIGCDSLEEGE